MFILFISLELIYILFKNTLLIFLLLLIPVVPDLPLSLYSTLSYSSSVVTRSFLLHAILCTGHRVIYLGCRSVAVIPLPHTHTHILPEPCSGSPQPAKKTSFNWGKPVLGSCLLFVYSRLRFMTLLQQPWATCHVLPRSSSAFAHAASQCPSSFFYSNFFF